MPQAKNEHKESLEQLADRLDRMATETLTLAQEIRRKAEEIGEHERRRRRNSKPS